MGARVMLRDGHCRSGRSMGWKGRYLWIGIDFMAKGSCGKGECAKRERGRRGSGAATGAKSQAQAHARRGIAGAIEFAGNHGDHAEREKERKQPKARRSSEHRDHKSEE